MKDNKPITIEVISKLQNDLMSIQSDTVCIRFRTGSISSKSSIFASSSAKYTYGQQLTDEILQNLIVEPWTEVDWRIGVYAELDIDVSIVYKFDSLQHSIHRLSENEFEVRYTYEAVIEMSKANCKHFFDDLTHTPQVQPLIFSFILNGEELEPDEHQDLFLKSADFTFIQDISLEVV